MSLILDSGWLPGMVSGAEVQVYCEFDCTPIAGGGDRTVKLIKASRPPLWASPRIGNIISEVGQVAYSIDPLTRKPTVGALDITVSDGGPGSFIRTIISDYYWKGREITLSFGPHTLNNAGFAPLWSGRIDDIIPEPGAQRIVCRGASDTAKKKEDAGLWSAKHPSEIALEALTAGEVPSGLRDDSSFNYDADTDISHFTVCRSGFSYTAGSADPDQITAVGAINDARVKDWKISGLSEENTSNGGRVYPQVIVSERDDGNYNVDINLYRDHAIPIVVSECNFKNINIGVDIDSGDFATFVLTPPSVAGTTEPIEYGVRATVKVKLTSAAPFTVALASTSYLIASCVQYGEELKCTEVSDGVARLCNASVIEREDGELEWKRFDPDASAVAHWGDDVLARQGVDIQTIAGNLINRVLIEQTIDMPRKIGDDLVQRTIKIEPERNDSYVGHNNTYWDERLSIKWCSSVGALTADITDVATSFTAGRVDDKLHDLLSYVTNHGMCGTAAVSAGPTQAAARKADNTNRFCYFALYDGDSGEIEIVKVGTTSVSSLGDAFTVHDPIADGSETVYNSVQLACSNVTREQLGTTKLAWERGTLVVDVTLAYLLAEAILDRFEEGCPIIGIYTNLSPYAVQVAEFVTLADTILSGYNLDGVDSNTKWEVISKEPDLDGKRIKWTLARVAPASNTSSTHTHIVDFWRQRHPGETSPFPRGSLYDAGLEAGSVMIVGETPGEYVREVDGPSQVRALQFNLDSVPAASVILNHDFAQSSFDIATIPPDNWEIINYGTWGSSDDIYVDTTRHKSGSRSLKFISGDVVKHLVSYKFPIVAATDYSMSYFYWGDAGGSATDTFEAKVNYFDESGAFISTDTFALGVVNNGQWDKFGPQSVVAPATARFANCELIYQRAGPTGNAYNVWVDSIEFRKQETSTGITGGQTIYGGTGSAENIRIQSTVHGTKGKILLGAATSAYDEVNERLGIGTDSPTEEVHAKKDSSDCEIKAEVDGDYFPALSVERSGGSAKTNREWQIVVDSNGGLILQDATGATTPVTITTGQDVGIGGSPTRRLDVQENDSSGYAARLFNDGNSSDRWGLLIQCGADDQSTGTHYHLVAVDGDGDGVGGLRNNSGTFEVYDSSDARLKRDIAPTKLDALTALAGLPLREFRYNRKDKADAGGDLNRCGLVAQDCAPVLPELVQELPEEIGWAWELHGLRSGAWLPEGALSISPMKLIPILVRAVQQLLERIEQLEGGTSP